MTLPELQAKRDEILARVGEIKVQHGDKHVEYGEASKALAVIDAEISRQESLAAGGGRWRTSFVSFGKQ